MIEGPDVDLERLRKLAQEYAAWDFKPDGEALTYIVSKKVGALMAAWAEKPEDTAGLNKVEEVLAIMKRLDVGLDLWQSQNIYFSTGKALGGKAAAKESGGQKASAEWIRAFKSVGQLLRVDPAVFLPSEPV